jgi:hypothetical protein
MKITPQKLAVLLDIKKKDARLKIIYALEKKKGNIATGLDAQKYDNDPSIDIKDMSDHLGIDLEFYVKDIKENYLKRSQTRGYIMNYPDAKLKVNKKGEYPRTVSVPSYLKCFISKETVEEIVEEWKKKYSYYVSNHNVSFK